MSMNNPNKVHAAASVVGNPAAFTSSRGFASVTRNGVGNWTLVYDQQIDPAAALFTTTARGNGPATFRINAIDTEVEVLAFDGLGAALDVDFDIEIIALSAQE